MALQVVCTVEEIVCLVDVRVQTTHFQNTQFTYKYIPHSLHTCRHVLNYTIQIVQSQINTNSNKRRVRSATLYLSIYLSISLSLIAHTHTHTHTHIHTCERADGSFDIVMTSPENLTDVQSPVRRGVASRVGSSRKPILLAIDEAHLCSEWGEASSNAESVAFREEFAKIGLSRATYDKWVRLMSVTHRICMFGV